MLVVEEEEEPEKDVRGYLKRMFRCRCDCGKERVVAYVCLKNGSITSCGCTHMSKKPPVDLTGRRFGHLTVLYEATSHYTKGGNKMRAWTCVCDCGQERTVLQNSLIGSSPSMSCGCALQFSGANKDHINKDRTSTNRSHTSTNRSHTNTNRSHTNTKRSHTITNRKSTNRSSEQNSAWEDVEAISGEQSGTSTNQGSEQNSAQEDANAQRAPQRRRRVVKEQCNLIGNRYGYLTVIGDEGTIRGNDGKYKRRWRCKCDCGEETVVWQSNLIYGHTCSCGCMRLNSLKGRHIGKLTVLEKPKRSGRLWKCQCECGNTIEVDQDELIWGTVSSCGCQRNNLQYLDACINGLEKSIKQFSDRLAALNAEKEREMMRRGLL